jgi:hypothetical protein
MINGNNNTYNLIHINKNMKTEPKLLIFALVAMAGLMAVFAIEIVPLAEQADARGCNNSIAINASKGRCFQP